MIFYELFKGVFIAIVSIDPWIHLKADIIKYWKSALTSPKLAVTGFLPPDDKFLC